MRIALISDIHGNLVSLQSVLADIEREQVNEIVCLGDVAAGGPQPREVVAQLMALDCPCVMGNHDLEMLNLDLTPQEIDGPPLFVEWLQWCANQLSKTDFEYMRAFQPLIEIPLDTGVTLLCFHGSPRSNTENIFATTPITELDKMLAEHSATVMSGGHTHVQMLRRYNDVTIVNAGSVGAAFEQMPFKDMPRIMPWAEYAITSCADGVLGVDLRRVPIDFEAVTQAASSSDMPAAEQWIYFWKTPAEVGYGRSAHS